MAVAAAEYSPSREPLISILVATCNRPDDLIPCLHSLLAQDYSNFEVIVFDQSDTDKTERNVRAAFGFPARLRFLRSGRKGKSLALNYLMQVARGDILAFTDDDTAAPSDWLADIAAAFAWSGDVDIVFGQVRVPPDRRSDSGLNTPAIHFYRRRFLQHGEIAGMGANMAMRRAIAARVGAFDEMLGPGAQIPAAEEGDFLYRAHRAGARVLMEPTVSLIHLAGRDDAQWSRVLHGYGRGDAAFAMKHLRCGDWQMVARMARSLFTMGARGCRKMLRHRTSPGEFCYVRGYLTGLRQSLRLPLDSETRLYRAQEEARLIVTETIAESVPPMALPAPSDEVRKAS